MRRSTWLLAPILGLCIISSVHAVITRLLPLKQVLAEQPYIFIAKITDIDAAKPSLVLKLEENLKGKAPFERMPVNLTGDAEGIKEKHTPQLLKRVAKDLPIIFFASKIYDKVYIAFGYTNGTWFQMKGHITEGDSSAVRWAFTHCEPYLRRTFKGTTEELKQVITDGLAGKQDPPGVSEKEPPGLGPEIKSDDAPKVKGNASSLLARSASEGQDQDRPRLRFGLVGKRPLFGVIPTVAIGGPLAILAMLFPTLFGKPKEIMRRWLALLTVASMISIVYLLHAWLGWWPRLAVWLTMAGLAFLGVLWAWRRHRQIVEAGGAETMLPSRGEETIFRLLSLVGLVAVPYALAKGTLFLSPWLELLLMWVVVWAGTLGILVSRRIPKVPLEGVMLSTLLVTCLFMGASYMKAVPQDPEIVQSTDDLAAQFQGVAWTFTAKEPGSFDSSPLIANDHVYIAAAHRSGLSTYGRLYCLDRNSGNEVWRFDDDGEMKQVFSSPCIADGRVFLGEGYHQDSFCKLYCLDAKTGKKLWAIQTKSHTESSPCVANGKVYFGAGDDGVFCIDAATGKELWHFEGLHVDTNPTVVAGKLYGGSGYGEQHFLFCLNADNGQPIWKVESRLPAFGSPTVHGNRVFFGTGNGNLIASDAQPAGAVLCLKADTGEMLWRFTEVTDAVHTQPTVFHGRVYFGSRDGFMYCVSRTDGTLRWKHDMGSPVVAEPKLDYAGSIYAVSSAGRVCCFDPDTGQIYWQFSVAGDAKLKPQVLSSPRISSTQKDGEQQRMICFGTNLDDRLARLYCLKDKQPLP